eukprot:TRINITY_DN122604_c0_g1_i1.p1 TRINITY_DN122604_c0_g1~~TRINITY_DN122604_c0_g1_i1.p1  ORF type:complete len:206 (+),score=29.48 TRINITY_DN122604_c0_g1_i1:137-754(+)
MAAMTCAASQGLPFDGCPLQGLAHLHKYLSQTHAASRGGEVDRTSMKLVGQTPIFKPRCDALTAKKSAASPFDGRSTRRSPHGNSAAMRPLWETPRDAADAYVSASEAQAQLEDNAAKKQRADGDVEQFAATLHGLWQQACSDWSLASCIQAPQAQQRTARLSLGEVLEEDEQCACEQVLTARLHGLPKAEPHGQLFMRLQPPVQ